MPTKSTGGRGKLARNLITTNSKQRLFRLNTVAIKQFVLDLLGEPVFANKTFEVGVVFVDGKEITRLNETYLGHKGSTDIITFDYSESAEKITGELFISVPDALEFAQEFETSLESELARYCIHGFLHLIGFDDKTTARRKVMKAEENRLLRHLSKRNDLTQFFKK